MTPPPAETPVTLTIDGHEVVVDAGSTILDACTARGIDVPTICWAPNLTPVNVCRVCVVEVEGSRPLVPACSRPVTDGMTVATDTDRVSRSRRMVLELLASVNDLDQAPEIAEMGRRYGADPARHPEHAARVEQPIRIQDTLYIRDYDRCVLCYRCVEACGDDAQHTYAIAVAGRGFDARISTEFDVTLPESACVYCGNCVAVCPTNALQFHSEYTMREAGEWRPGDQSVTRTVCSYCGVGCNLELHVQDERIVKVSSPADHDVTWGNLCVKGRFGYSYVHPDDES